MRWDHLCRSPSISAAIAFPVPSASLFELNARIEPFVKNVHEQIDENVGYGDEQHGALHDRVVALVDAVDQEPAYARPREDGLNDCCAAQEPRRLLPDDGHRRYQRG